MPDSRTDAEQVYRVLEDNPDVVEFELPRRDKPSKWTKFDKKFLSKIMNLGTVVYHKAEGYKFECARFSRAASDGPKYLHRVIVEWSGVNLQEAEIVFHNNGNNLDNTYENLSVIDRRTLSNLFPNRGNNKLGLTNISIWKNTYLVALREGRSCPLLQRFPMTEKGLLEAIKTRDKKRKELNWGDVKDRRGALEAELQRLRDLGHVEPEFVPAIVMSNKKSKRKKSHVQGAGLPPLLMFQLTTGREDETILGWDKIEVLVFNCDGSGGTLARCDSELMILEFGILMEELSDGIYTELS